MPDPRPGVGPTVTATAHHTHRKGRMEHKTRWASAESPRSLVFNGGNDLAEVSARNGGTDWVVLPSSELDRMCQEWLSSRGILPNEIPALAALRGQLGNLADKGVIASHRTTYSAVRSALVELTGALQAMAGPADGTLPPQDMSRAGS